MPLRITVEKEYQGEFWTNVYYCNGSDPVAAVPTAEAIINAERPSLDNRIIITRYRIDDNVEDTDNYHTVVLNVTGGSSNAGVQLMPLFAVLRVDLNVTGSSPSRKYYRGYLLESMVDGPYMIASASLAAFQTSIATPLGNITALCDVDGQDIASATVYPKVSNRQLRRGSKKKVIPSTGGTTV